jgi:hypothetical protein
MNLREIHYWTQATKHWSAVIPNAAEPYNGTGNSFFEDPDFGDTTYIYYVWSSSAPSSRYCNDLLSTVVFWHLPTNGQIRFGTLKNQRFLVSSRKQLAGY